MSIEKTIARHCSPVLMRRKPANLFRLPREQLHCPELQRILRHYHLSSFVLCSRCKAVLVMVYHPAMLQKRLYGGDVGQVLDAFGYSCALEDSLRHLRRRILETKSFPHEIGLFLGYPTADVIGFMRHKGKHCKLCGLWKVYGDVECAQKMFAQYRACKKHVLHHLENGGSLYNLPMKAAV